MVLNEVQYIPNLKRNFISTSKLDKEGFITTFRENSWKIIKDSMVIAKGKLVGMLYFLTDSSIYIMNFISIGGDENM